MCHIRRRDTRFASLMARLAVPRIPLLPDPMRRIRVPRDLAPITSVGAEDGERAAGIREGGVDRIWRAVEALYRTGVYPAIAVCVRRKGHVVIDRTIGWSRLGPQGDPPGDHDVLATPGTPFVIFSASKAMTATLIHLLDERGALHIADRVAEYIDRKSTRLNSSHSSISYAVFCLKKKKKKTNTSIALPLLR